VHLCRRSARACGYQRGTADAGILLSFLAVFAWIYALLRRRSGNAPVRWGWIAAILGCAGVALLVGVLSG
jgi:hypothetical protein